MTAAAFETELDITREHPSFPGHFPGRPILPGVVLLAETLAAIESATGSPMQDWIVTSAKFTGVVGPGARLTLVHEVLASGAIRFRILSADGVVANGTLSPRATAASTA